METRIRLDATIRNSWKLLSQHVPEFPPELSGPRPFALENSLTLAPLFYESEGHLQCAQIGYFGFYALRAILRGILLSVNHLSAAKLSADHELYGPSIASAYAAAYHATGSLLALHGHVFCEFEDNIITGTRNELGMVAVLLTRKSTWICEHRNRTHRTRWLELAQVYRSTIEELPECFNQVFFYRVYHD
jgi:hypothetical protein